jgi:hypothetical protein
MAIEPITITTAIITLSNTLERVIGLLNNFANAEKIVADIKRDCVLTKSVLEYIRQQLDSKAPPTLRIDGPNAQDAGISLQNVLEDNVEQLQLDLSVLETELSALSDPCQPDTRIGKLVARGQVSWKMANLRTMQQKIVTKQWQLQLVLSSLKS